MGARTHRYVVYAIPCTAALAMSVSLWITGTPLESSELLFVWCALFASYCMPPRPAAASTVFVAASYAVVVIGRRGVAVGLPPAIELAASAPHRDREGDVPQLVVRAGGPEVAEVDLARRSGDVAVAGGHPPLDGVVRRQDLRVLDLRPDEPHVHLAVRRLGADRAGARGRGRDGEADLHRPVAVLGHLAVVDDEAVAADTTVLARRLVQPVAHRLDPAHELGLQDVRCSVSTACSGTSRSRTSPNISFAPSDPESLI
jgi:hypothetical protein